MNTTMMIMAGFATGAAVCLDFGRRHEAKQRKYATHEAGCQCNDMHGHPTKVHMCPVHGSEGTGF